MNDVLGRELKDGDLCIGMAIGRRSNGMHIGIFKGASVVYLSKNETFLNKSCTGNTYLIENPTEQELVIKDKIQKLLTEEENERKRKASLKTIPLSKLEVGGVYKDIQGYYYVYLGKRKVTFSTPYRETEEKEGNCFAYVWFEDDRTDEAIIDNMLYINTYRSNHNISVLKGNKKLTEMVRKINIEFPLVNRADYCFASRWNREQYILKVE